MFSCASFLSRSHPRLLPIIVSYSPERAKWRPRADQRFENEGIRSTGNDDPRLDYFFCANVILRDDSCRHPLISASSTLARLFGFISSYYIVSLSRSYLWLLSIEVNGYLMRCSPYTLRLMVYVTESILHAKFLFPKIRKSAVLSLFFLLSLVVGLSSTSSSNTFSFVDTYQNWTMPLWGKDASHYPLCFSRENMKEAIVLDTVADLMPVTLICNHEVKATKPLSHFIYRISTLFFILQLDFYYKRSFNYFDTEKPRQSFTLIQ